MNSLVSIIIPAFNIGHLIKETIDSVLGQTYQNFELIIIDDGSTDNTKNIIDSYSDSRIKYKFQSNSGRPAIPRNVGIKMSQGEYIAFLDHDDIWFPDKLESQMKLFESGNNLGLICSNGYFLFDSEKTNKLIHFAKSGKMDMSFLFPRSQIIQSSVIIPKKICDDFGGFNEDPNLKALEDFDLWLRILLKYPGYYIDRPLVYYRIHSQSTSGSEVKSLEREKIYYEQFLTKIGIPEKFLQIRLSDIYFRQFILQVRNSEPDAKDSLRMVFKTNKSVKNFILYLISFLPNKILVIFYKILRK